MSDVWGQTLITSPAITGRLYFSPVDGDDNAMTLGQIYDGIAGGKEETGGTGSGENLTLHSTEHSTKGQVRIGTLFALDEAQAKLAIGHLVPSYFIHVKRAAAVDIALEDTGQAADVKNWLIRNNATVLQIAPVTDAGVVGTKRVQFHRTAGALDSFRVGDNAGVWTFQANVAGGRCFIQFPAVAPTDGALQNGVGVIYQDETTGHLHCKWKESDGTVQNKQLSA